tara:strand:- start:418 stop:624 length:207 start_codon:yes stop_codon:yes gene_type:complete
MYYYLSIIVIALIPTGSPVIEQSMTGPFITLANCLLYEKNINIIIDNSPPPLEILSSECRKEDKGKII